MAKTWNKCNELIQINNAKEFFVILVLIKIVNKKNVTDNWDEKKCKERYSHFIHKTFTHTHTLIDR